MVLCREFALHDHSDFKNFGKEKIADGPDDALPIISHFRQVPLMAEKQYDNSSLGVAMVMEFV